MPSDTPTILTLLLVDDSRTDREIYKLLLSRGNADGYRFVEADCMARAVALAERTQPDCLLIDYQLPDGNGIETYRQIRRSHPHLPAILMTGEQENVGLKALQEGFQDFLTKGDTERRVIEKAIHYAIERKRAERQRHNLEEALEQQRRFTDLQQDFFAMITHEFRIPLALIRASAESLSEGKAAASATARISQAALRLETVIDRALELSGVERGGITPCLYTVNLKDALEATVAQYARLYPDRRISCYLDALPETWVTDPALLGLIIGNLLDNGLKYTPGSISVCAYDRFGAVEFEIVDEGAGIAEEELPHIWEKYRRGKGVTNDQPGSGLGLYLSRAFTLLLGGSIRAENIPGGGFRVRVALPHAAPHKA